MEDFPQAANTVTPAPAVLSLDSLSPQQQHLAVSATMRVLAEDHLIKAVNDNEEAYWQAAYDSTEAGKLWLERKRRDKADFEDEHPEWLERTANVERFLEIVKEHPMELNLPADPGSGVFAQDFSTEEPIVIDGGFDRSEAHKTKLALLSASWIASLTPGEAEAVSWITSNGAHVLNAHVFGADHEWNHKEYSKQFLDETLVHFRSAMAKAPELEEPIVIYRGTLEEYSHITEINRPVSASSSFASARSFRTPRAENVVLEIKTAKVASVCGASSWGVSEQEVLAPLGRYRKVGEFTALRGRKDRYSNDRPEIDPSIDTVRIVQLEYLGP